MTSADVYRWLMNGAASAVCQQFDAHVIACVLSLAVGEANEGRSLCDALGLTPEELSELAATTFPHAVQLFAGLEPTREAPLAEDEVCLRDLLSRSRSERTRLQQLLAFIIARRALSPNHLWQDLGLRNRRELSWLMSRHFEPLATRNAQDMKWKKFLYRTICRDQSFSLCVAPSCAECEEFNDCFGDESGESLLAIARRDADQAAVLGGRLGLSVAKPTIVT
jgi:nitrogen fixation protein NifQ